MSETCGCRLIDSERSADNRPGAADCVTRCATRTQIDGYEGRKHGMSLLFGQYIMLINIRSGVIIQK